MKRFIADLLISLVALALAYAAAWQLSFAWSKAFVNNRTFTVHLGFIDGSNLLMWLFYFIFFFAFGFGLPKLLRTKRPVPWLACFGLAYSLVRLATTTNIILEPSAFVYARIVGDFIMPVLGCVAGALLSRKLRRTPSAHHDSLEETQVGRPA